MVDDRPTSSVTLSDLGELARRAASAKGNERAALDERAAAVAAAVRAGARLEEIGRAAGISKAGASAIARKTLGPRLGRGGPFRRRRGAEAALEQVAQTARRASDATRWARSSVGKRDQAVLRGADAGLAVRSMAEALGMDAKVVYTLIRRRRREAT